MRTSVWSGGLRRYTCMNLSCGEHSLHPLLRIFGIISADSAQDWEQHVVVTSMDFSRAIKEIHPAYTHSEIHVLDNFLPLGFLPCGESHDAIIDSGLDMIHVLLSSTVTCTQSLLLYGPRGCAKTMASDLQ